VKEANGSNTTTDKKNRQKQGNTQSNSHHLMPSVLPRHGSPSPGQLPPALAPSMMALGIKYPICLSSLGQPAGLCPLLASGEN